MYKGVGGREGGGEGGGGRAGGSSHQMAGLPRSLPCCRPTMAGSVNS